jgi:hypothetical protein
MPSSLPRRLAAVFAFAALFVSTGCIEFERVIVLKQDLSGTASFTMTINMEPMATFAMDMARSAGGGGAAPTEQEIADAKKGFAEGMAKQQASQPPLDKKAYAASLPAGITLIDAVQKLDGMKMKISMSLGFDDVKKLATLRLKDPMPSGAPSDNDLQPFNGLEIKDEGRTLLITAKGVTSGDAKIVAPDKDAAAATAGATAAAEAAGQSLADAMKEMMDSMGGADAMKSKMEGMMKDMREVLRIETPLAVVDTNATKREPGAIVWEVNFETLMKAMAGGSTPPPQIMTLRIRK